MVVGRGRRRREEEGLGEKRGKEKGGGERREEVKEEGGRREEEGGSGRRRWEGKREEEVGGRRREKEGGGGKEYRSPSLCHMYCFVWSPVSSVDSAPILPATIQNSGLSLSNGPSFLLPLSVVGSHTDNREARRKHKHCRIPGRASDAPGRMWLGGTGI